MFLDTNFSATILEKLGAIDSLKLTFKLNLFYTYSQVDTAELAFVSGKWTDV